MERVATPATYELVGEQIRRAIHIGTYLPGDKLPAERQLAADLKAHQTDVAEKIIGSVVVDAHHTTEAQLLAKAREFYAEFNKK